LAGGQIGIENVMLSLSKHRHFHQSQQSKFETNDKKSIQVLPHCGSSGIPVGDCIKMDDEVVI